jgi:hypothetical protein
MVQENFLATYAAMRQGIGWVHSGRRSEQLDTPGLEPCAIARAPRNERKGTPSAPDVFAYLHSGEQQDVLSHPGYMATERIALDTRASRGVGFSSFSMTALP